MTTPLVSIVIPTLDGMQTLPGVLDAVATQSVDFSWEIVAIDSSSTDGTAEYLRQRGARVEVIPRASFNHGLTRNRGVAAARGTFVVLLSQDATPANDQWLHALVQPLRARPEVAGTFARQAPRPEASAIARFYQERWVTGGTQPRSVRLASREAFDQLPPAARHLASVFDNVCSCVRRSVWEQIPFRETAIAEDLEWGRDVLCAGYELVYVPDAVVQHSHDRSPGYELERTYLLHQRLYHLFGLRTIPSVPALAAAVASSLRLHRALASSSGARGAGDGLARALALAFAWPLGQYLGGVTAARGRQSRGSPRV